MFNWKGFENREFCVDFKSEADKRHFLKECEKQGIRMAEAIEKYLCSSKYCNSAWELKTVLYNSYDLPVIIYNPHPIDCSIAENYINERVRMRQKDMSKARDLFHAECNENPKEAIEILQAWSDEHPIEPVVTYLDKLKEVFPNTELNRKGTPIKFCPRAIGLKDTGKCRADVNDICEECWSQPYKENSK